MMNLTRSFSLIALLLVSVEAFSAGAVIVHPSNNSELDRQTIAKIYLGKRDTFSDESNAIPIDQEGHSGAREVFLKSVLNKSSSQFKSYWSKLLFSGKGTPPKKISSPQEIKTLVSENSQAIGYVDSSLVDESVKVVLEF